MSERSGQPAGLREERATGRGWGSVMLMLLVAVLLLGGAYVGAAYYFKDRPPSGVSVAGVDIGSLTEQEARKVLTERLADRTSEPIVLRAAVPAQGGTGTGDGAAGDGDGAAGDGDGTVEELSLLPGEAGLSLDLDATLAGVTGLSFDPRVLWSHVAGTNRELPLRGAVDRDELVAEVSRLKEDFDRDAEDGEVAITEDGVEVQDAVVGRSLDVEGTTGAVEQAWLGADWPAGTDREVEASTAEVAPGLTQAEVDRFTQEELDPALSAPVLVTASRDDGDGDDNGDDNGDGEQNEVSATAELAERDLRGLLSVEVADGQLSLGLDDEALLARIRQDLGQLEAGPQDATVRLAGSDVEVVPSRVGYTVEEDGLVEAVRGALSQSGDGRSVEAEVTVVEPAIPTEASERWRFTEMGSFVSAFPTGPGDAARTANLHAGVAHVNGTVVMPGEQFSLGQALGDISESAGYVKAPVIMDGRLVMGLGGGLSQISTVVFNTSWNAGVQLDAHTPHSFYISRYPAGREATLAYPVIDNVWTNDTDNPVVVRAWISGNEIHMTYLGQRQYDVRTIDGQRHSTTTGETRTDDSEDCVPQSAADGFTITVARVLTQGGSEVHRDEYTTTYQASDQVTCTNPAAGGR